MSPEFVKANMLTIEGTLVMFLFMNPRSFVIVKDKNGAQWTAEWESANSLRRHGVASDTLQSGDHVALTGYLAEKEHRLEQLMKITRPVDNWEWRRRK